MRSKFTVPVLASILILGIFGFSALDQQAYAESDEQPGSPTIQIIVDTTGGDDTFVFKIFNATNPADSQQVTIDTATNNQSPPIPVQAGSYSVEEDVPSVNWRIITSDCVIDGESHGSVLNFNIFNGQIVVCTFVNLFTPPEPTAVCGDGIVTDPETCDDGNDNGTPGFCNITCNGIEPAVCGDGIVTDPETCDDGNTTSGDGCDSSCMIEFPPEPTSCTLRSIDNAPRNQCAGVEINEICVFSCDAGFEPVPPTLTCQEDGEFDASPVCEAIPPPPEPTKVEVCHKNKKTLSINPDSLDDHLGHGDIEGACVTEDKQKKVKDSKEKEVKEPKEEKQKKPKKSKK